MRKGFSQWFIAAASSGGEVDPITEGLALLATADAWWDVLDTAPTTVDVTFNTDVSTWSKTNCTVASGVSDPDGGSGAYRVTATAAGNVQVQHATDSAVCYDGYCSLSGKVRHIDAAPTSIEVRVFPGISPGPSAEIKIKKPSLESAALTDLPAAQSATDVALGFQYIRTDAEWREFEIESMSNLSASPVFVQIPGRLQTTATAAGDCFDVYDLQFTQKRVSSIADRNGGAALAQATNIQRPTLAPTAWLGNPGVIAAPLSAHRIAAAVAIGAGTWLTSGTVMPCNVEAFSGGTPDPLFLLTGATASVGVTIEQAAAGNEYQGSYGWTWTNDTGTTTSGSFGGYVASVPVAVSLYYDGASLVLYIDGQQVGSPAAVSGTSTITGFEARGRQSHCLFSSYAVRAGAHTATEISNISLALRAEAGLPSKWKLVHWAGQSNSTNAGGNVAYEAMANARFRVGNSYSRRENEGYPIVPWTRGPVYRNWAHSSIIVSYSGPAKAFVNEADKAGDFGYCVFSTGRGSTDIDQWMSGAGAPDMHTWTRDEWADAKAFFGTHLYDYSLLVWIQGESDMLVPTAFAGGYEAALTALVDDYQTEYGTGVTADVLMLRVNENYVNGTAPDRALVFDAQDSYAAAHANTTIVRADYASATYYDGIHYTVAGDTWMGRNLYRGYKGLALDATPT